MRQTMLKGQVKRSQLENPVQIPKVICSDNERRFELATSQMKSHVLTVEKKIELKWLQDIETTGTEFECNYRVPMPKNEVGDYTGGEFPKKKKTGILDEEDVTELQRRRN
jgi:hypothetical protein